VYKCARDGESVYSDSPCPGGKVVDVTPPVQGFVPVRPRRATTQKPEQPDAPAVNVASEQATERSMREARCALILAAIDQIDARARQPQTVPEQDRLREERRKLVDERYALRC
jgi:hypothetical protein